MGNCVFCNKPAGFFKGQHAECALADAKAQEDKRQKEALLAGQQAQAMRVKSDAKMALNQGVYATIHAGGDLVALEHRLLDAIVDELISHSDMTAMLVAGYERCVEAFLDDGLLDDDEERRLQDCRERFALSPSQLDRNGAFSRVAKSSILRIIMTGNLPPAPPLPGCTVNFQKGETPVWSFADAEYMEDVVRKQFVGRSQGMSFRIMSGIYYRVGGFKGESVATVERKHLGTGTLIVTDQNLYFVGAGKTTRIPYAKIVSFTPFSDGFGVMRDLATAKPQFFLTADGWFAYNLVTNLAKI